MQKIIIIILAFVSITLGALLILNAQNNPYALVMLNCGGEFRTVGSHVSYHPDENTAKASGDTQLASFDIAYIYQPASNGEFTPLVWVKTDTDCYNGNYRDWTQP